jgi:hypothetical protein
MVILQSTQTTSSAMTPLFKMTMEYRLFYPGGDTTIRVFQSTNEETFYIHEYRKIDSIRIDPDNEVLNGLAGIQEITQKKSSGSRFSIYPNPNNGSFTFRLVYEEEESYFENQSQDIVVEVYNVTGQQVYDTRYEGCLPYLTYAIESGNLARGIYIVRFGYGNSFEIKKIIIE